MNLKEIVNRPDHYCIEQNECLFVIKQYVKTRKGVDIKPTSNLRRKSGSGIKRHTVDGNGSRL